MVCNETISCSEDDFLFDYSLGKIILPHRYRENLYGVYLSDVESALGSQNHHILTTTNPSVATELKTLFPSSVSTVLFMPGLTERGLVSRLDCANFSLREDVAVNSGFFPCKSLNASDLRYRLQDAKKERDKYLGCVLDADLVLWNESYHKSISSLFRFVFKVPGSFCFDMSGVKNEYFQMR